MARGISWTRARRSRLTTIVSPISKILRALATRSSRDLVGRATQLGRAKLETLGVGGASGASVDQLLRAVRRKGIDGPDELLAAFQTRVETASLGAFRDREHTVDCLKQRWPEVTRSAQIRAERISAGRFDLLGHEGIEFGDPIDWAFEPVNGRRAPDVHWSRVPYLDPDIVGDHKVVWELNRHQYFVRLGQAAWLGSSDDWAEIFFEHLDGWMSANPPRRGINWASSLEIAFRAISWLWALHFFARAPQLSPRRFTEIVAQLRAHGRHVERYISTSFSPNTHLTGEALGLFYLGTMLPELPEAERWRRRARTWLMGALEFQIRPDGGYFEQSVHYHRYTVDFYVHLLVLERLGGGGATDRLEARLANIVDHLVSLTRADGSTPLIGDDDGGRLLFLDDRRVDDVRSSILAAAVLLNRADWAAVAGPPTEELVWLLGPDALDRLDRFEAVEARRTSRCHPDTGFCVMRSGRDIGEDVMFVRSGPHSALSGGHAHADALAIDLSIGGHRVLVDPGTGSYTDRDLREWFRSSPAHNTVTLAGNSSSQPSGPFAWSTRADSTTRLWVSLSPLDFFEGSHSGFERLGTGLVHERSVLYVRDGCRDGYWVVRDRIAGASGAGPMRAHFQFAPGLSVSVVGETALEVVGPEGGCIATLRSLGPSVWEEREGRVSPVYGRVCPAPAWVSQAAEPERAGEDLELVTLITRGAKTSADVQRLSEAAWQIGGRDFLALGRPGLSGRGLSGRGSSALSIEEMGIESDFDWVWGRRDERAGWEVVFGSGGAALDLGRGPSLRLPGRAKSFCVTTHDATGEPSSWLDLENPELAEEARHALGAWARQI